MTTIIVIIIKTIWFESSQNEIVYIRNTILDILNELLAAKEKNNTTPYFITEVNRAVLEIYQALYYCITNFVEIAKTKM